MLPRFCDNKKCLYFITDGKYVKIGVSNNPFKRLKQLQTGHADRLRILANFNNKSILEGWCHKYLEHLRTVGEWFIYNEDVDELIDMLMHRTVLIEDN